MLPVAILAGGLATRLRPVTETIPKALVQVAGRPFIDWQLEDLARQGIRRVVMCTGYLGEQIEAHVGDGKRFGLEVRYSPDGPTLLGTGGALKQALPLLTGLSIPSPLEGEGQGGGYLTGNKQITPHLGLPKDLQEAQVQGKPSSPSRGEEKNENKSFFVLYGDSFLPVSFSAVETAFRASGLPALMTVLRNGDRWDKSNVLFKEGRLLEYNKKTPRPDMEFIDYGLGVLSGGLLAGYPETFDLAELYHALSLQGQLAGFEVFERFYEMGSPQGLKETEAYFSQMKTLS